jgi:phosphate-selective porin OprO/OprP
LELEDSSTSVFVPDLRFMAGSQQLLNFQLATANASFWTMAEWYGSWIDQDAGGVVFYQGCHVDCGYFLTGEHRQYEANNGTLGAVRVKRPWLRGAATDDRPCGWGAWELAARFSYLDFVDADTPLNAQGMPQGLRLPQATFGVNWYLSDRVRLMLNYNYDMPDEIITGNSTASMIATRLAVFW